MVRDDRDGPQPDLKQAAEIRVRSAIPHDAAAIAAIYVPIVERTAISFEETAPSVDEMRERIAKTQERWPWLVAQSTRILGYAYGSRHRERAAYRWSVDVTVYVAEDARGIGVGKALYAHLFDLLKERGFYNAFAGIALPNDPSIALHRAFGFEAIGIYRNVGFKLGQWRDVSWWQLRLHEATGSPAEPIQTILK